MSKGDKAEAPAPAKPEGWTPETGRKRALGIAEAGLNDVCRVLSDLRELMDFELAANVESYTYTRQKIQKLRNFTYDLEESIQDARRRMREAQKKPRGTA